MSAAETVEAQAVDQQAIGTQIVGTQIVGLTFARYVVQVEPMASMSAPELVELMAPIFQSILVAPLTD